MKNLSKQQSFGRGYDFSGNWLSTFSLTKASFPPSKEEIMVGQWREARKWRMNAVLLLVPVPSRYHRVYPFPTLSIYLPICLSSGAHANNIKRNWHDLTLRPSEALAGLFSSSVGWPSLIDLHDTPIPLLDIPILWWERHRKRIRQTHHSDHELKTLCWMLSCCKSSSAGRGSRIDFLNTSMGMTASLFGFAVMVCSKVGRCSCVSSTATKVNAFARSTGPSWEASEKNCCELPLERTATHRLRAAWKWDACFLKSHLNANMVCMHTISCIRAASFCCLGIHRLRCHSLVQFQDEEVQDALPGGMSVMSHTHPPRHILILYGKHFLEPFVGAEPEPLLEARKCEAVQFHVQIVIEASRSNRSAVFVQLPFTMGNLPSLHLRKRRSVIFGTATFGELFDDELCCRICHLTAEESCSKFTARLEQHVPTCNNSGREKKHQKTEKCRNLKLVCSSGLVIGVSCCLNALWDKERLSSHWAVPMRRQHSVCSLELCETQQQQTSSNCKQIPRGNSGW